MKNIILLAIYLGSCLSVEAQESDYTTQLNIHYYPEKINLEDEYIDERCVLDV